MSRLHIVPAMMPVESRTILRVNISGVVHQTPKTDSATKESFSNTLKRRPTGRRFSMQKARSLQAKLPPGRAVVLFVSRWRKSVISSILRKERIVYREKLCRVFPAFESNRRRRAICTVDRRRSKEKHHPVGWCFSLERLMGVEPTYAAWEAAVLPMNYSRRNSRIITDHFGFCNTKNGGGMKFPVFSYSVLRRKGRSL